MTPAFDVAVVGSGFAGSLFALVARRLGRSVLLLEKGRHPRFAIGESSSPLANILLEELADRHDLPRIRPLAKWGTWRRAYPRIGVGKKRGFSFFAHDQGKPFACDPSRADQLLVAASPCDEIADTHWYRADVDAFLAGQAAEEGAEYVDELALESVSWIGERAALSGRRHGATRTFSARLLVDASGREAALSAALGIERGMPPHLLPTQALYTHFEGARRLDEILPLGRHGDPPYPVDDAALHHVFPGGWIWVLRFENGITSAGLAATDALAEDLALRDGAPAWERLLARFPTVRAHLEGARPVLPFVHAPRLSFRVGRAAGRGWVLLPSAAAFVDPLLSTGFPLALLGIERLAKALEEDWGTDRLDARLAAYGRQTLFEADAAALLVAALYSSFDDFPLFAALSKLYFAAASFSEASRRLGRSGDAFLCADRPGFGESLRSSCLAALSPSRNRAALIKEIERAVEPLDIVGLLDRSRRNWHPVLASDLIASREKLSATRNEIEVLLERSGFPATVP